jgi:hypothetical protein
MKTVIPKIDTRRMLSVGDDNFVNVELSIVDEETNLYEYRTVNIKLNSDIMPLNQLELLAAEKIHEYASKLQEDLNGNLLV